MDVKTKARLTLISLFLQINLSAQEKLSKLFCLFFNLFLFHCSLYAQDSLNIEFGKIKAADFNQVAPKFDSGASAVIIADIGKTYFDGDRVEDMNLIFTRFMRVKIINKNGFHIADYEIRLIKANGIYDESISELKGSTFNFENGNIQETKLEPSAVYTEKFNKYIAVKKFTMPALKEGSIYDITYTVKTKRNTGIRNWEFQSKYPCLWSEYQVKIPPFLFYNMEFNGNHPFYLNTHEAIQEKFRIGLLGPRGIEVGVDRMSGNSYQYTWVKKDLPSFKDESYISSIKNYADRLSFQYNYLQFGENRKKYYGSATGWGKFSKVFMALTNLEDFLQTDNSWMENDVQEIVSKAKNSDEIIHGIYYYIRDNFKCTDHHGLFPTHSLNQIFKNRSGNVAEINFLLIAMLQDLKINAEPAILSTRENGYADLAYPILNEYNYLICIVRDDNKIIKLDASWPMNPYGHLTSNCYNGGARTLNEFNSRLIDLLPDSLIETKRTSVIIVSDEKEGVLGSLSTIYGLDNSFEIRQAVKKSSQKDYFKNNQIKYANEINTLNYNFDSLENYEMPLILHCDLEFNNYFKSDMIYFNPMMGSSLKENPFNSNDRRFPVEMPYRLDEVYLLSMDIPSGYQVEEIPKSENISLNDNQGSFEYNIDKNADNIQMRVHFRINKTIFPVKEYTGLREFYNYIIKKESEQIVFKKIHS
jgi:hypothetical protein